MVEDRPRVAKGVTIISLVSLSLMLISGGGDRDGRRWNVFVEGSTTGSGGGRTGGIMGAGGVGGFWASGSPSNVGIAIAVTAMAGLALAATVVYSRRGSLKSPWSRRRRKHALLPKQWKSFFRPDGKLSDGGVKFLKKVRSGGVDPSIRTEVWPFLLGIYDVNSSKEERDSIRTQKRKEYENLRRQCRRTVKNSDASGKLKGTVGIPHQGSGDFSQVIDSPGLGEVVNATEESHHSVHDQTALQPSNLFSEGDGGENSELTCEDDTESSSSSSSEETETTPFLTSNQAEEESDINENPSVSKMDMKSKLSSPSFHISEDFITWQRIIRLDAVRANAEWVVYSPSQASVSETKAQELAETVGLKDYDHLEPCRIYHASRLVAILEAYALYDPEIGYCQGMSDLLSPIISVIEEDHLAFWCFVGFMKKARHNFRLDEVGIRRQLSIVSKIIKNKDSHLYRHLEKLEAEDCFFVYRMVVVLFRRELTFEQTLCLWEVMWADQAAIRAGIAKSAWGRIRLRAPPTDDLLLFAIAACVLQRRKLIVEKYSSMEEIMRECNSMAGHLDVWKLLDDAHDLVVNFHDKI